MGWNQITKKIPIKIKTKFKNLYNILIKEKTIKNKQNKVSNFLIAKIIKIENLKN